MSRQTPFPPPILFFFFLTLPFQANSQTPDQEKTILLNLKQLWSNPSFPTDWSSTPDQCSWSGITCSTDGFVTQLRLIEVNITTAIPQFICDLKNLSHIELQYNYIPGPFPEVLYNCLNLVYLDLSQNNFIGNIPDDVNRLSSRLQFLNIGSNNFTGDIPVAITQFPELQYLFLNSNFFNGSFPPEIGNMANLVQLILSFNAFVPSVIPSSFTQLKKLTNLSMTECRLIGQIPENIGNLTALELLDLSVNNLSGSIPRDLFLLKNLSEVYLFKNKLTGQVPQRVEALNLYKIDLSANNLTGSIPEDFGKLTKLSGLLLFFNQFSGQFPASIGRLPALSDVRVFSNNFSGELPPDFGKYSRLVIFEVATNGFNGTIPESLCANGVLRGLVTFDNDFTGEVPKLLGSCDSLEVFRVHGNRLSGNIPDGLWTSFNLTTLMIGNNSFTGQLPDKLARNLSLLDISNNQFSGDIPTGISSWNNLRDFKASNNLLTGTIPQELTALPNLNVLLLDGNQISGPFPSNIISWTSLTTLNFSRNQFDGEIPVQIASLPVLTILDLSENEFSGQIPPQVGLMRLTSLNLSSNKFTGSIPAEFENAAFDSSFLNNPGLCASNPSLGLRSCHSKSRRSTKYSSRLIAVIAGIAAVLFVLAVLFTILTIRKLQKRKQEVDRTWRLTSFQRLSFTEVNILSSLTENNLLGSGGSGMVYRVPINRSGQYVAVKRIWNSKKLDDTLDKEFAAEVQILGTIRHQNIVKLLCYISSEDTKLLVYEYMENRSLDQWLHVKKRSTTVSGSVHRVVLDWPKRMRIAVGAAQGLCYMHHDSSPPIIHRDVKSSNILLDSEFNAKIADFGLARILIKRGEPNTVSTVAGSFGYIAPEYAHTTRVNEKIDVYSFGVILLELVTGREANDGNEDSSLAGWAWSHLQGENPIEDALDNDIKEPSYIDEMSNVFKLGIICTGTLPSARPSMKDVLKVLLRCSHMPSHGEKFTGREYDSDPLLKHSRRERMLNNGNDLV